MRMFDIKVTLGLILVDFLLYVMGVLFWFSDQFAHGLGVFGFKRFLAGLICIVLGLIVTLTIARPK